MSRARNRVRHRCPRCDEVRDWEAAELRYVRRRVIAAALTLCVIAAVLAMIAVTRGP